MKSDLTENFETQLRVRVNGSERDFTISSQAMMSSTSVPLKNKYKVWSSEEERKLSDFYD
jgi:hypothetical protein